MNEINVINLTSWKVCLENDHPFIMTLFNEIRRGHLIELLSCIYLGFFLLCLLNPSQVDGKKKKDKDESTTSAVVGSWLPGFGSSVNVFKMFISYCFQWFNF